jgi:hypothetical protein
MISLKKSPPVRRKGERGQAIILIVFSIIGLIGMTALAIDGGNAMIDRRRTETAASAAALTGALTRIEGGDWRSAALATANANGYNNDGVSSIIEMNTPPLSGPYAGNSEYIEVIITSHLATYFGQVIGVPQVTSVARAVARTKPSELGPMFDGFALVSLAPNSECDPEKKKQSFWIHNEATITLTGGGIFVNSDNTECAFRQMGSGSVRIEDTSPIVVVGGEDIQKTQLITPYPIQTGAVPIPYPPAIKMPEVGCGSKVATVDEFTGTSMSPGKWDGGDDTFPPEGVNTLEAGIYCISGDAIFGEGLQLEGKGVLLIIEDGNLLISGGADITLTAPQHGRGKGLLVYMPISNQKRIALNGGPDSRFRGTIFAPAGDVRINGTGSKYGFHSQIIGYYIEVDGTDNIPIHYTDEENYDSYNMPEVLLSE